uniref:Uncharacterized protein n=1 Tax=Candidatus Kentrum sp. DK TaxID=2126562 RepID=A0A450SEJ8_9GAMM|nr:MAG: hypothetical protein BECKDK2373C_GA0170839_103116 [Candidatus Kentron sp. DK]
MLRFLRNCVQIQGLPILDIRSQVHDDLLARLYLPKRLDESGSTLSNQDFLIAWNDSGGYLQPTEILLVIDIFVRRHEHMKTGPICQMEQFSVPTIRPSHFLNSGCMMLLSQPTFQLPLKAFIDQDTYQAAFCNSKNDSA